MRNAAGSRTSSSTPMPMPHARNGSSGITFFLSSRVPRATAPMQSRMTTTGITNLSGHRCASSGTAISVDPNPEMPKIT